MIDFLRKHKWPLAIFAAAFLIRLIYLIQYRSNPSFYFPMVDEQWHFNWAKEIIGGNFWGNEAYFRGPLYPYFLAILLKFTGSSILWSRILQALIPSFSAVLIYLLGEMKFSKKVGIIASLGFSLYGTMVFYDTAFLIEVLFIFLNLLAVYFLIKYQGNSTVWKWLIAGILMGLSAITRPNILLLTPLVLAWIFYLGLRSETARMRLSIAAIYLGGMLIPLLTVTLRNYMVTGETILISSQGGVNFYIGNNPEAEGLTMLMPEVRLDESLPWTQFTSATREAAEKEAGKKLTAGEESSFWTDKALKFIWNNPGQFIGLSFKKLVYFCLGFENSDNQDIYFSRGYSSIFSILLWHKLIYFPFGLLFPFAVVGLIELWKNRKELALFYIFIFGYIPTIILFLVTARHRLPVIPFMLLFAAAGATAVYDYIKRKQWNKVGIYAIIFFAILIFANRTYFDIGFQNISQAHFNMALSYEKQGNLIQAEQEYIEALRSNPNSTTILNNLGYVRYRMGRLDEAMASYNKAIQSDAKFAQAYNNMGLALEAQNKFPEAESYYKKALNIDPDLIQAYLNLGDIYLSQNDFIKAELYYLQANEAIPTAKEPFFKLAALYARQQEFDKAENMFIKGEKLGSPGAFDYVNWGNIYYAAHRPQQALQLYRKSLLIDGNFAQAYYNMAMAFRSMGGYQDSTVYYLQKALKVNPQFQPAREMLNFLK